MHRIALISAVLILSGCLRGGFRPGEEVLASDPYAAPGASPHLHLKPSLEIPGYPSWDEAAGELCWIPVGTRLRVASEGRDGKVAVRILEGRHEGESVYLKATNLRRP